MYKQSGILVTYGISDSHVYWLFLRCIPLWRISLVKIYHLRRGSMMEFLSLRPRRILKPWRYWVWGTSLDAILRRQTTRYLLETRGRSIILMRLTPGFHYVLRTRISSVRVKQVAPAGSASSVPLGERAHIYH